MATKKAVKSISTATPKKSVKNVHATVRAVSLTAEQISGFLDRMTNAFQIMENMQSQQICAAPATAPQAATGAGYMADVKSPPQPFALSATTLAHNICLRAESLAEASSRLVEHISEGFPLSPLNNQVEPQVPEKLSEGPLKEYLVRIDSLLDRVDVNMTKLAHYLTDFSC